MTRHLMLTAAVATAAVGLSLAGGPARRPALLGAGISSAAALGSFLTMARVVGPGGSRPMQKALAVFAGMFLVRLVAVALGLVAVVRAGESVTAFVGAFFVPYFIFAAIEGSYLHGLGRAQGKTP